MVYLDIYFNKNQGIRGFYVPYFPTNNTRSRAARNSKFFIIYTILWKIIFLDLLRPPLLNKPHVDLMASPTVFMAKCINSFKKYLKQTKK